MAWLQHPAIFFVGLVLSNIFMSFAWYAHLKNLQSKPWFIAALVSWGIALAEYLIMVPTNRLGYQYFNLGQLKIYQEAITLAVFVPFALLFMKEKLSWHYGAAALCVMAAVIFISKAPK